MIKRSLGALLAIAAAVFLVLLAHDVWAWQTAVRDGDARAQAGHVVPTSWQPSTILPGSLGRDVLGAGPDVELRRWTYRAAQLSSEQPTAQNIAGFVRRRTPVEETLTAIEGSDADPRRASLAATYLGVLLYTDPEEANKRKEIKALVEFQNAALLDPTNDTAKTDLELMLEQSRSQTPQGSSKPGGGDKGGRGGAGLDPSGHGY